MGLKPITEPVANIFCRSNKNPSYQLSANLIENFKGETLKNTESRLVPLYGGYT